MEKIIEIIYEFLNVGPPVPTPTSTVTATPIVIVSPTPEYIIIAAGKLVSASSVYSTSYPVAALVDSN